MDRGSNCWWLFPRWREEYQKGVDRYIAKKIATESQGDENPVLVPLNYISWDDMPTKEIIWDYVKKKFIVPEEGKGYVLQSIGTNWRLHKHRVKKATYRSFDTFEKRLANRPKNMPEKQFKELLEYWNSPMAQEISEKNKKSVENHTDPHIMGPCSFAMKRHEMQQKHPEKKLPSKGELYCASRIRVPGRTYKTDPEPSQRNIEKLKEMQSLPNTTDGDDPYYKVFTKKEHSGRLRLHGRGVTKASLKKKEGKAPFILSSMYMDSIEKHLEEKITSRILSELQAANLGLNLTIPSFATTSRDGPIDQVDGSNENVNGNSDSEEHHHSD